MTNFTPINRPEAGSPSIGQQELATPGNSTSYDHPPNVGDRQEKYTSGLNPCPTKTSASRKRAAESRSDKNVKRACKTRRQSTKSLTAESLAGHRRSNITNDILDYRPNDIYNVAQFCGKVGGQTHTPTSERSILYATPTSMDCPGPVRAQTSIEAGAASAGHVVTLYQSDEMPFGSNVLSSVAKASRYVDQSSTDESDGRATVTQDPSASQPFERQDNQQPPTSSESSMICYPGTSQETCAKSSDVLGCEKFLDDLEEDGRALDHEFASMVETRGDDKDCSVVPSVTTRGRKQNMREVQQYEDYGGALLSSPDRRLLSMPIGFV